MRHRGCALVNAEKMGLEKEIGSLEAGEIADLLVLAGNPLADTINTIKQRYIVADGVVYEIQNGKLRPIPSK